MIFFWIAAIFGLCAVIAYIEERIERHLERRRKEARRARRRAAAWEQVEQVEQLELPTLHSNRRPW